MDVVTIHDHEIAYRDNGAGPAIVFLHGWPLDSREFSRQLDRLGDAFRVIAWDAPAAGDSTDPDEGSSLSDWADWLAEFIEALGIAPVHIAGLSWGGGLALEFADRHPELLRSLILMSAYAGWAGSLPADEVERRLQLTILNTRRPPSEWASALVNTFFSPGVDDGLIEEAVEMVSSLHPAATRIALRAFAVADLRAALHRINIPTLMIYGTLDLRAPRGVWEPIHAAISGSKLVLIPEVGHMVDMQAGDRCNAEIRAFIEELTPPTSRD